MEHRHEPGFEHTELRGITIKNMIVTVVSTVAIVSSVLTTFFSLKADMKDNYDRLDTQNKVLEVRVGVAEAEIKILQSEVNDLQKQHPQAVKTLLFDAQYKSAQTK